METPEQKFNRAELHVKNSLNFYLHSFFNGLTVSHLLNYMGWSDRDILGLFIVFQYAVLIENGVLSKTPEDRRMILQLPYFKNAEVLDNLKEKTMSLPFKNERSKQIILRLFLKIYKEIVINLAEYNEDEDVVLYGELPLDQRLFGGKGKRKKKKTKKYKSKKKGKKRGKKRSGKRKNKRK